jgi:hypothetical protein
LRSGHEVGLGGVDVGGERRRELRRVEEQEAVLRRQDRRHRRARRRVGDQRADRFALVGSEGGDVDEPGDLRVGAGFGDDDAAVRVTDEEDGPRLGGDRAPGERHVDRQRGGRILDDGDLEAVVLQQGVDAFPPGAVDEAAVNQTMRGTDAVMGNSFRANALVVKQFQFRKQCFSCQASRRHQGRAVAAVLPPADTRNAGAGAPVPKAGVVRPFVP